MLKQTIQSFLEGLDKNDNIFKSFYAERGVSDMIDSLITSNYPSKEDIAESIAFKFLADYRLDQPKGIRYYGPMIYLSNIGGDELEVPDRKKIDHETINYWEKRAIKCTNPILIVRYADLVIEFSKKIRNTNPNINLYQKVIDNTVWVCDNLISNDIDLKQKSIRALSHAIQVNDKTRIENISKAIIRLEHNIAEDSKAGLWGFSIRHLILKNTNKVKLQSIVISALIEDMENRLQRVFKAEEWYACKSCATILMEYYSKNNDEVNLIRILEIFENSLRQPEDVDSHPLVTFGYLEEIKKGYEKFTSRFPKLNIKKEKITQEIANVKIDPNIDLKKFEIKHKVKIEDIKKYITWTFGDKQHSIQTQVSIIAINFLPKIDDLEKSFRNSKEEFHFMDALSTTIISDDGIVTASVPPIRDGFEENLKQYISQSLSFGSYLLNLILEKFFDRYERKSIFEYLSKSLIFEQESPAFFYKALQAYNENNFIVSSHLFIPMIETGFRNLIKICGGVTLKDNEIGGYDVVNLNKLLTHNDYIFDSIYGDRSKDFLYYSKLLLIDHFGFNLRNDFAHGINKKKFFSREVSNRLFHVLLLLSIIIKTQEPKV